MIAILSLGAWAQNPPADRKPEGAENTANTIVGIWRNSQGTARFNPDGTGMMDGQSGRYQVRGDQLTLIGAQGQITFRFEVKGDTLTFIGTNGTLTLNRVKEEAGPGRVRPG